MGTKMTFAPHRNKNRTNLNQDRVPWSIQVDEAWCALLRHWLHVTSASDRFEHKAENFSLYQAPRMCALAEVIESALGS